MEGKKLNVHGRVFVGKVTSAKRQKTVKVVWEWKQFVPKYERYVRKRSVIHAHVPEEISVHEGDIVKIGETRPISKTKNFIVIENITQGKKGNDLEEDKNAGN